MKAFYYYMQYLDQALFPQLALLAVGSVSVIHKELCQWLKYVHLLYNSMAGKLLVKLGMPEQFEKHKLPGKLDDLTKVEPRNDKQNAVKIDSTKPYGTHTNGTNQVTTPNHMNQATKPNHTSQNHVKRSKNLNQISKRPSNKDEIDDIFDSF